MRNPITTPTTPTTDRAAIEAVAVASLFVHLAQERLERARAQVALPAQASDGLRAYLLSADPAFAAARTEYNYRQARLLQAEGWADPRGWWNRRTAPSAR